MNSRLMRTVTALGISGALALTAAFAEAPAAAASGDADASCRQGPSLLTTLSGLRGGSALKVERLDGTLKVIDLAGKAPLFVATCGSISRHGEAARTQRPDPARQSRTFVRRDGRGGKVYTHAVTSRGARVTVVAAGQLLQTAVHITTFDNDDLHVADGEGRLIHSVTTKSDGTLVEREGKRYGCGCERITHTDGRTENRPLP